MADVPCSLAAIQRWMQSALLAPGGAGQTTGSTQTAEVAGNSRTAEVAGTPRTAEVAELAEVVEVAEVVAASGRLTAEECFRIYRRGYRLRLLRCMRGQYPGMVHLLGRELFDRFALDYLDAHPSRSPSLDGLGAGFPGHLARTRPDTASDGTPHEEWIDLLIDLARYERDFAAVLDGPETGPDTDPRAAPGPGPGPGAGPDLRPGTRLFEARFPVHRYAAAVRRGEAPEPPAAEPILLALSCRNGIVVIQDHTASRSRTRRTAHQPSRPSPAASRPSALEEPMPHLTPPLAVRAIDGITTLDSLADHLGDAARIELSTIPPYLYAAYSIKTSGYSQWAQGASAQRTLIGVAIEEMLHMALVRNVMVGTGCETVKTKDGKNRKPFRFYDPDSIPAYPGDMSHRTPPLTLHMQRISTAAVEGFMEVELPETVQQPVLPAADGYSYHTLGELYRAIGDGITYLTGTKEIKWGLTESRWTQQYLRAFWNQWGGPPKPVPVVDQGSALDALYIIVSQGEGAPDEQEESHYEKFTRIRDHVDGIGVVYDDSGQQKYTIDDKDGVAVWPVVTDPKATDFPGSLGKLALLSDAVYCYVLALLDKLYLTPADDPASESGPNAPDPTSQRYALERGFIAAMQGVLSPVANILVSTPLTSGPNAGQHAGPTFGHYDFKGVPPQQVLLDLCTDPDLAKDFPQLGGIDGVLNQIRLLPYFTV